jgi:hypothetical protein
VVDDEDRQAELDRREKLAYEREDFADERDALADQRKIDLEE